MNNKEYPLVSIIIPVYNGERFITRAIQSCVEQTYYNIEILIINNESTDNTLNILNSINDERVKILNCKKGRSRARNLGLKVARGKYITFLDADDTLDKERIRTGVVYLEDNQDIYAHSVCVEYLDEFYELIKIIKPTYEMNKTIIKNNPFPINSLLFLSSQGLFFENGLEYNEDWLFFSMLLKDRKVYIDKDYIGASVYIHGGNTMSNILKMFEFELVVYKVISKYYNEKHFFDNKMFKLYLILLSEKKELNDKNIECILARLSIKAPFLNVIIKKKVNTILLKFDYNKRK